MSFAIDIIAVAVFVPLFIAGTAHFGRLLAEDWQEATKEDNEL